MTLRKAPGSAPWWLLAVLMPLAALSAEPGTENAQATLERVTRQVLETVRSQRADFEANPDLLRRLVDRMLLPYFDFKTMARLTLGKYWRQADSRQQQEFLNQFRILLVNTYAAALLEYAGQQITYLPMRPSPRPDVATVRAQLHRGGGGAVKLTWRMHLRDGVWQVYDLTVDGISLLTNFRGTFGSVVRNQGIDGLLQRLREHNRQADKAPAASQ